MKNSRREFLLSGGVGILAIAGGRTLAAQSGWSLRFLRIPDSVEIRVGGARGPMIQWPPKGCGRTWCRKDGTGGDSITQWVGTAAEIRLYGNPIGGECVIEVSSGGHRETWAFGREDIRAFRR